MLRGLERVPELNGRVGIKTSMLDRSSTRVRVDLHSMIKRSTGLVVPATSVNVKTCNITVIDDSETATALECFVRAAGLSEVLRKFE